MSRKEGISLLIAMALVIVLPGVMPGTSAAQSPTGPNGEKLVPLEIKLPKPLFQCTPQQIKPTPNMEKYSEKPRPPFYAPPGVTNLALHKKVTSSDNSPVIGELSMVTDGEKEGADDGYVELAPGKQWVQIDLGAPANLYAVVVWHYHAEGRVYHGVVVQVSDDPEFRKGVATIYNNDFSNSQGLGRGKQLEYIDDNRGRLIDARNAKGEPVAARYVRLYSNGNTSNDLNHYVEVEVYGKAAR
jgi:hypothetical protein